MPVVISLLNAFTGLAAAATGFELSNNVLIVSGMLVGASGTLLTLLMGRAMNRSITNVLFGAFGQVTSGTVGRPERERRGALGERRRRRRDARLREQGRRSSPATAWRSRRRSTTCARSPTSSRRAASRSRTRSIRSPAACPGHMNVLLAEANVPYAQLKEMDEANAEFSRTDVALVIGANDVVNPDARANPGSPIYGMPILNVDQSQAIVVLKRSMNPGFAGHRQSALREPEDGDAVRRREGLGGEARRRRQGRLNRSGSKSPSSGGRSPRIARATSPPHARPSAFRDPNSRRRPRPLRVPAPGRRAASDPASCPRCPPSDSSPAAGCRGAARRARRAAAGSARSWRRRPSPRSRATRRGCRRSRAGRRAAAASSRNRRVRSAGSRSGAQGAVRWRAPGRASIARAPRARAAARR